MWGPQRPHAHKVIPDLLFKKIFIFNIYFCFSLVAASGGYSSLQGTGFSLQWFLLLWSTGSAVWHTGLEAPQQVGSSQTRDRTGVPWIARQIPIHWTPRGAPSDLFFCPSLSSGVCSDSCPLSQWYLTISSSTTLFSFHPQSFPASVFSSESVLCIRWPKF